MGFRVAALSLLFFALPAAAAPEVVGVELHLPPGADPTGLPALVAVHKGERLSARDVRRSVERLYATGRLADVVVRAVPLKGGVNVVFELSPVRKIGAVRIDGNQVLGRAELLAASRLSDGAEFYPERIDEAVAQVRAAYARHGYEHAQVEVGVVQGKSGLDLTLTVHEGPPVRLAAIELVGTLGLKDTELREAIGLSQGDVLDRDALAAGLDQLRALYRAEGYYRAEVSDPTFSEEGDRATVAVPIDAGPKFSFHFRFNRSFPDAALAGVLDYDGEEPLDEGVIARLARRVEAFYRYRGFPDARVDAKEETGPKKERAVVRFEVDEGAPMHVREVDFEGNHALATPFLRAIVAQLVAEKAPQPAGDVHPNDDPLGLEGRRLHPRPAESPDPVPSSVFVEEAYHAAAELIAERYHELGYLSAQVQLAALDRELATRSATVRFVIIEGPRTVIRSASDRGLPEGFVAPPETELTVGEGLNRAQVEQARAALQRSLGRRGYLFAQVDSHIEISPDRTQANVELAVVPGPQVRVGQVIVQGLRRTDPELVRANLALHPGQVLDPEKLFDSQRDLVLLGVFRQVAVKLIEPELAEPTKDIVVELRERPRLSGEIGGGYSLADGPRVIADVIYPNLFGRGINLSAHATLNYVGLSAQALNDFAAPGELQGLGGLDGRANISVQQQRIYSLYPLQVGARLDLVGERIHRPSYRYSRFAAIAGADWAATRWLALSFQAQVENDRVRAVSGIEQLLPSLDRTDAERLRFPDGNFTLFSAGPSLTLDFRDDPVNPHRGVLIAWSGEVTKDLGATRTDSAGNPIADVPIFNFKTTASFTGYVPLGKRVVFAASVRGGRIFPLDPKSETIAPKRFFLGGALSLRGFGEDALLPADRREDLHRELAACQALANPAGCSPAAQTLVQGGEIPSEGGELFTLGKAELRFPAFGSFDLGVFVEAGNLWLSAARFQPLELRYVAGVGLRYVTPVGPLALDLGFNLHPDQEVNEPTAGIHFSVGLF